MFERFLGKKETKEPEDIILKDIDTGIDEDKIVVELQPVIDAGGKMTSAEALSRYKETDDSVISPLLFVPMFESAKMVSELDKIVVEKVATTLAGWKVAGFGTVNISINLSRIDLNEPGFMDRVHATFMQHGIAPDGITFELHESAMIDSYDKMAKLLQSISSKGYRLAIDDLGSNGHLLFLPVDIPVDMIKFNMDYLTGACATERGKMMVESFVNGLSKAGIHTVAGGVESKEQQELALSVGISAIQGFFHDKPLTVDAFEEKFMSKG